MEPPLGSLPNVMYCFSAAVIVMLASGAIPETVYIHAEEVSDVTYVNDRARVKVKAIGALTRWDVQSLHKTEEPVEPVINRVVTDFAEIDEPTVDLSKVSVNVCAMVMVKEMIRSA